MKHLPASTADRRTEPTAIAYLLLATFAAHFLLMSRFGLYEDDFLYTGWAIASNWQDIYKNVLFNFSYWPQGRPLGLSIPVVISYLGYKLGGLPVIYLAGFAVISINVCLAYLILRKFAPPFAAVIGALAFSLYPADTTKILLIHSLILQCAWTFTLAAMLAYLGGRTKLYIPLAFLPLITYESMFLPLFAIPLLRARLSRDFASHLARHTATLLLLVAGYAGIRYLFFAEERLQAFAQTAPLEIIEKVLSSVVAGPLLSVATFFLRPVTALTQGDTATWLFVAGFFLPSLALLYFYTRSAPSPPTYSGANISGYTAGLKLTLNIEYDKTWKNATKLVVTGLVMWPTSYLLAFSHWPPGVLHGRIESATNIAGTFASSLLVAGLLTLMLSDGRSTLRNKRTRTLVTTALALYTSLLAGFHFIVQRDYADSWTRQREFWHQVISLTPDINENSLVIVPNNSLQNTENNYIDARSWANLITLYYIYDFPNPFVKGTPRIVFWDKSLLDSIKVVNGKAYWRVPRFINTVQRVKERIDPSNIILLQNKNGELKRYTGMAKFAEGVVLRIRALKESGTYKKTALYHIFMNQD